MNINLALGVMAVCFIYGLYVEHEFNLAGQTIAAFSDVKKAQAGETNIIKFDTNLDKVNANVKSPCVNTAIPSAYLKLRKQ